MIIEDYDNKEYYNSNKKLNLDLTIAENNLKDNCEIEVTINEKEDDENVKELVQKKKENSYNDLKNGINIIGI